jgi:hypothetical protein
LIVADYFKQESDYPDEKTRENIIVWCRIVIEAYCKREEYDTDYKAL